MRNKKGFTLIEMLVVVGIIVILTGLVGVNVVQNIQRSNDTKTKVELHYSDGYNTARADVEALRSAKYGDPDGYTADPDPVDPDPVDPDPVDPDPVDPDPVDPDPVDPDPVDPDPVDPDPVDPDPVDPDPVDPDPVDPEPVLPQPAPGTSVSSPTDTSSWGTPYNWKFVLGYPQDNKAQYLTLYIPTGATLYMPSGESRGVIVSQSGNEAVIKVNAWQNGLELGVSYPSGGPELVITVVSRKAP